MFEAFSLSMLGAFSPSLLPVKACKKHQWGGGGGGGDLSHSHWR